MSCPRTMMRPESGRMRPSANFKIRLLPEPATPKIAFVSPRGSWKETPRNTSLSAKESATSSKRMTGEELFLVGEAAESSGKVGADMESMLRKRGHEETCND